MKKIFVILGFIIILFASAASYAKQNKITEGIYWKTKIKTEVKDKFHWYSYYLQKVYYKKNNEVQWITDLPNRICTNVAYKLCKNKIDLNKLYKPYYLRGLLYLDNAVFISDGTGILILNKKNGEIIKDISINYKEKRESFDFDKGNYIVKIGHKKFSGETYSRASFVAECENYIVHFNGMNLMIFKYESYELIKNIPFDKKYFKSEKQLTMEIESEPFKVVLIGRIFF